MLVIRRMLSSHSPHSKKPTPCVLKRYSCPKLVIGTVGFVQAPRAACISVGPYRGIMAAKTAANLCRSLRTHFIPLGSEGSPEVNSGTGRLFGRRDLLPWMTHLVVSFNVSRQQHNFMTSATTYLTLKSKNKPHLGHNPFLHGICQRGNSAARWWRDRRT